MTIQFAGFSKLDRLQRINYIVENRSLSTDERESFDDYCAPDSAQQVLFNDMIENYIGNFPVPMGIVPHILINGESLMVPFVTEESSVVASAAKAAKYWITRGGFKAVVTSMTKKGQVHFTWNGDSDIISNIFPEIRQRIFQSTNKLTRKMRQRGGGITEIQLLNKTAELPDYYQIDVSFETADAMGANFINSCLESIASVLPNIPELNFGNHQVGIIMSILSNYTPDCIVRCYVECPVKNLTDWNKELKGYAFAAKFKLAVDIANLDISRAVTHNKGIMNGVDAVLMATGNDSRATAASVHAYASREGRYKGLSTVRVTDEMFRYELELPLAIGSVGGISKIHPVVQQTMAIMNYPDAGKLMMIAAASGLANNFAAIASLITSGIQAGHMKMHLSNILNQLQVNRLDRERAINRFNGSHVSYAEVEDYICQLKGEQ
ncbi:MAG: hydroxymethylglutaryl-CoA reductase [Prolixibacteraceae bacterium]|jgi:hydroxymethylglutaryl-CoA reductase|nr:hydroxymethylglutaryl-CoA reductase [Prolixibacteraceae bacterium]